MDCLRKLATQASTEIHNIASRKPMPDRFSSMVQIVERALRSALQQQREAFLRESRN